MPPAPAGTVATMEASTTALPLLCLLGIVVGIVGAFLGGFCFGLLGIVAYGFAGRLVFAVIGALLFTWLLRFIRK